MIVMISGTERRARWRFNGTNVVARRANCQRHITCWESTNPTHCVSSLKSVNSLFEKKTSLWLIWLSVDCELPCFCENRKKNQLDKTHFSNVKTHLRTRMGWLWNQMSDARRKRPITVFLKTDGGDGADCLNAEKRNDKLIKKQRRNKWTGQK